jgi:ribulose-5-phosphate 4-epimerase/fuculose-1-phosphate aldolase
MTASSGESVTFRRVSSAADVMTHDGGMFVADLDTARTLVSQSCRIIGKMQMTREPAGHVSWRIPGTDTILIKARGAGEAALRYVTPDDLIICDMNGKKVDGPDDLAAPNEVYIHTWLYRTRPDVHCVIHVHPTNVVLFTICNKELLPLIGAYDPFALQLVLDGIPRYPRSVLISNDQLGQDLAQVIGDKSVCLMRGHGITAVGGSVEDATITAWRLNDLAEINYRAALLGNPEPIPDEDIEVFRSARAGRPRRQAPAEGSAAPPNSTWRYLTQWIEE